MKDLSNKIDKNR